MLQKISYLCLFAVEVEVKSEQQINEIFDAISYAKGASVIRYVSMSTCMRCCALPSTLKRAH